MHFPAPSCARGEALAALALVLAAVTAAPAGAVSVPQRILAGPEDQLLASENATYVIWTQSSVSSPNRYHAYERVRATNQVFRLSPRGTRGYAGGIDPDQDRAIYQQIDGQASDLFTIDLGTLRRIKLPVPINTGRWEWGPRISNSFFLFARDAPLKTTIFLYDRAAKTMERLVSLDLTKYYVAPGAVGERYARGPSADRAPATRSSETPTPTRRGRSPLPTGSLDTHRSWMRPRASSISSDRAPPAVLRSASCGSRWRISLRRRSVCSSCRSGSTSSARCPSSTWERGSISGSLATAVPRNRATSTGSETWGSRDHQPRSSGFVRHVGPPSPFLEISPPS
jgi:hypothetical protein